MAWTGDEVFITQWQKEVTHSSQQKTSKLRDAVSVYTGVGEAFSFPVIGAASVQTNKAHAADLTPSEIPNSRVGVTMSKVHVSEYIEDLEMAMTNVDVRNAYTKSIVMAANRKFDDLILAALAATGNTATTLPSATTLNKAGVIKLGSVLNVAEVEFGDRMLITSAGGWEDMMNDVQLTSSDFIKNEALATGMFTNVAGFNKIILSNRTVDLSGSHEVYGFDKNAVGLAIAADIKVSIERVPQKDSWILIAKFLAGAAIIDDTVAWATVTD